LICSIFLTFPACVLSEEFVDLVYSETVFLLELIDEELDLFSAFAQFVEEGLLYIVCVPFNTDSDEVHRFFDELEGENVLFSNL
jgi:hypothetical protein